MMKNLALLFLALSTAVAAEGASSISIALTASPATTLAGIPVALRLDITNAKAQATLPKTYVMVAVPAGDGPFLVAESGSVVHHLDPRWYAALPIALQPGSGTTTVEIPADAAFLSPPWAADARLTVPGSYRVHLLLNDAFSPENVFGKTEMDLLTGFPGTLVTGEATLTVEAAGGEDAVVCAVARAASHDNARSCPIFSLLNRDGLARLFAEHPRSTYARALAGLRPAHSTEERIASLQAAIDAEPSADRAEWLRLRLAYWEAQATWEARSAKNLGSARGHATNAAGLYKKLATARSSVVRWKAADELDDFNDLLDLQPLN